MQLREDRSGFDLIPKRAAIVRRVFEMTLEGKGQHLIASTLNRESIPVFGRGKHWQRSYIKKTLSNVAAIGIFIPHRIERISGKRVRTPTEPVEGYFPAAIDRETYDRVAALTSLRSVTSRATTPKGFAVNILAGLGKCPRCGSTMTRITKGSGTRGGKPYLICTRAKVGAGCEYRQVKLEGIHEAIFAGVDEMVALMPSPSDDMQDAWSGVSAEVDALEDAVRRIVEAISAAGHSQALLSRLAEAETHLAEARGRKDEIEDKIAASLTNRVLDIAQVDFLGAVEAGDVPRINVALRQLFARVVVDYGSGNLEFHWKHAPGSPSRIFFAWPIDLD